MTEKHATPEWRKTVRIIRAQVKRAHESGQEVVCWRTGVVIEPDMPFDVGHMDPHGGEGVENAAPEARRANRSHGGRIGAQITNARKTTTSTKRGTFRPPAWA